MALARYQCLSLYSEFQRAKINGQNEKTDNNSPFTSYWCWQVVFWLIFEEKQKIIVAVLLSTDKFQKCQTHNKEKEFFGQKKYGQATSACP